MRKRLCLLLTILLILSGCSHDSAEPGAPTAGTQSGLSATESSPVSYQAETYTFDQEPLRFLCPFQGGYLLCTHGGAFPLDGSFAKTGDEDQALPNCVAVAAGTDGLWHGEICDPTGLGVYRDGTLQYEVDAASGSVQLLPRQEGTYLCDGSKLFRNETELALPEEGADGVRYEARAMVSIDGRLYAVIRKLQRSGEDSIDMGSWLCPIAQDTASLQPETGTALPEEMGYALPLCQPDGNYLYSSDGVLYQTDGSSIWPVVNLLNCGVSLNKVCNLLVTEDGRIAVLQSDCLTVLTPGDSAEQHQEPQTLVVGALYLSPTLDAMSSYFNLNHTGCKLEVKTYDSLANLNLALLSHEVDVLAVNDLATIHNYASKGILQPLEEVSPELFSSGVLYENMVAGLELNGSCYSLPVCLQLSANAVPLSYTGVEESLGSAADYFSMLDANEPEEYGRDTKEIVLENWYQITSECWVDWESREAEFTSPDFIALLEYANRFASSTAEAMANMPGEDYIHAKSWYPVSGLGQWHYLLADYQLVTPPFRKANALRIYSENYLSVVTGSQASAELLQTIFTDEGWYAYCRSQPGFENCFSVNRLLTESSLEAEYQEELTQTSSPFHSWDPAILKENLESLKAALNAADHFEGDHYEIRNILQEESLVYFNGDCTAEDAAQRIQSRVSIYLAEQG